MDADWVPLLQTLSWVGLIGLVLGLNRRRLGNLLDEVIKRVREGSSFQAGPVSLGEAPRDIKSGRVEFATAEGAAGVTVSPSAEAFFDDIAAHMDGVDADRQDVYLVHSATRLDDQTDDGKYWYTVRIWVEADSEDLLDDCRRVTYRMHPTFQDPIIATQRRNREFELWLRVWGEFSVFAYLEFEEGPPALLSRYLDLPGRPPY
jgi:hypothetical protein